MIDALIQLLGEEASHFEIIRRRLVEMGPSALPALERCAREGSPFISERADQVIESIRLETLDLEWQRHAAEEPCSLEKGLFLLARFAYPKINPAVYQTQLDEMADVLRSRISPLAAPAETLRTINGYLFNELRFSGNRENYYLPENSYINTLLETKRGIPISLSAVILLLGERLNLPLYGIGMPGHFLVSWSDAEAEIFIDPFNEGRLLTLGEIETTLSEADRELRNRYLHKVSARQILARMIRNLIHIYANEGETEKQKWLERFHERLLHPGGPDRSETE